MHFYQEVFVWSAGISFKAGDFQAQNRARRILNAMQVQTFEEFSWDERLLFNFTNLLNSLRILFRVVALMLQPPDILSDYSRSSTSSDESRQR